MFFRVPISHIWYTHGEAVGMPLEGDET